MKTALCALAFTALTVGVSGQGHEHDGNAVVVAGALTSGTSDELANRSPHDDPGTVQARGDES